jgi:hypothetical protein
VLTDNAHSGGADDVAVEPSDHPQTRSRLKEAAAVAQRFGIGKVAVVVVVVGVQIRKALAQQRVNVAEEDGQHVLV